MKPGTNARDLKEQVSLIDLLARLGYQPLRRSGKEHIYLSMLRDSDTKPSFCINEHLNVWYDHGTCRGGNLIDFGMAYWQLSFKEAINKIAEVIGQAISIPLSPPVKRRHAHKLPHYQIEDIRELGSSENITTYLTERGLWQVSQHYLREIHYFVEDEKKLRKQFYAAGWQNELGNWEVRNPYFKGCLGHKAITFIPGCDDRLSIFEGYFNFLSWLTENSFAPDSIIVLNTASLAEPAIRKAAAFEDISLYFDHDPTGRTITADFSKALPRAIDRSFCYDGYNDYNDKIKAKLRQIRITRTRL